MAKADSEKAIDQYLERLVSGTKMADKDFRLSLLDKTTADIAATKDPFVDLALALDPLYQQNREAQKRARVRCRACDRATCRRCSRRRAASWRPTRTARCA